MVSSLQTSRFLIQFPVGIACLVDDSASHLSPTPQQLIEWNEYRREVTARAIGKDTSAQTPNLNEEALRKRLERQKRKEQLVPAADAPPPSPSTSLKEKSYSFTIPGASTFPWYTAKRYHSLTVARNAGIWVYPTTPEESAKCAIFQDLWKQGYYMGNGLRFGGDWLIYPGE
jgi:tRNA-splicing endonuclease subunit Sen34